VTDTYEININTYGTGWINKGNVTTEMGPYSATDFLDCPDCKMTYTGQTGRSFCERFKEHFNDYKYRNGRSRFAQHLLDKKHPRTR
jgi:hypothetical protein